LIFVQFITKVKLFIYKFCLFVYCCIVLSMFVDYCQETI